MAWGMRARKGGCTGTIRVTSHTCRHPRVPRRRGGAIRAMPSSPLDQDGPFAARSGEKPPENDLRAHRYEAPWRPGMTAQNVLDALSFTFRMIAAKVCVGLLARQVGALVSRPPAHRRALATPQACPLSYGSRWRDSWTEAAGIANR